MAVGERGGDGGAELDECEHCGRSFNAAAFARHQRLCTAEKPMKRVAARKPTAAPPATASPAAAAGDAGSTAACSTCGRTFAAAALARHEAVCARTFKGGNAAPATGDSAEPSAEASASSPAMQAEAQRSAYTVPDDADGAAAQGQADLQPCQDCGRSFAAAALARHAKICKKVFLQKRKPLDSGAQRLAGARPSRAMLEPV